MFTPHTGKGSGRGDGSRVRWISAASSSSRRTRSCSTSDSAMRAFAIASAAEDASTWSRWASLSAKRPSPPRRLITSIAPIARSDRRIGAHRIERVTKPDCASIVWEKWGSLATSSTRWQRFSRTLRPTMPSEIGRRRPVIGCGPTQAWQATSVPSLSTSQSEPASASRWAAIIASARSSVVSMSIETAKSWVILASRAKAPARSLRPSVGSAGSIPAALGGGCEARRDPVWRRRGRG